MGRWEDGKMDFSNLRKIDMVADMDDYICDGEVICRLAYNIFIFGEGSTEVLLAGKIRLFCNRLYD